MLDFEEQRLIKSQDSNMKVVLKGSTGSGKSTILMKRYQQLLENLLVASDNILVLVANGAEQHAWMDKTNLRASGKVWVSTYYSFIQDELNIYYPLVLEKCANISSRRVKPLFLNFDAARYLVTKVVDWNRENKGIFPSIAAQSDKIAAELLGNHYMAAASGVSFDEIRYRLSKSLPVEDEEKLREFKESENILDAYRKKCISLGIFDYGTALEIYRKYLLSNTIYLDHLKKRIKHLIIDSVEIASTEQVDFINMIMPDIRTCLIGYNYEKGRANGWEGAHLYLEQKLFNSCEMVEMEGSYTCSQYMQEFSEKLFDNIKQSNSRIQKCHVVEREPLYELRSEMLEAIGRKVCELVNENGYKASEISVLSTYADPVTEIVISSIMEKNDIKLINIARKIRMVDSKLLLSMIVMAQICNPTYKLIPSMDAIRVLVIELFRLDPIRAFLLAGEIHESNTFPSLDWLKVSKNWMSLKGKLDEDKYVHIFQWVESYKHLDKTQLIDKFFYKLLLEVFLKEDISINELRDASYLIESANRFEIAVSRFGNMNAGKGFLEVLIAGMKGNDIRSDEEACEYADKVIIATPQIYLSGPYNHKIIILAGISSKNWMPRNIKELSNPIVLHKAWNKDMAYTEELEEENQKLSVAYTMRALTKKCSEKLIVFESLLSSNGYENDGMLADYL